MPRARQTTTVTGNTNQLATGNMHTPTTQRGRGQRRRRAARGANGKLGGVGTINAAVRGLTPTQAFYLGMEAMGKLHGIPNRNI